MQKLRLAARRTYDRHGRVGACAAGGLALLAVLLVLVPPTRVFPPAAGLGGPGLRGDVLTAPSVHALTQAFAERGYRLETAARAGTVPRLFLARLPATLDGIPETGKRKEMFLLGILPLVLHVNDVIRDQRTRLLGLAARLREGRWILRHQRLWLHDLASRYGTAPDDLETLLRRVDVIPPALALAQAAIESSWGRSRFAREGNALFGQWTYSAERGMKPAAADDGARHHVTRFPSLVDSVAAYAMNLNTHRAYAAFRWDRAAMRNADMPLDAYTLAAHLRHYSQQRDAYVAKLRGIIRGNRLARLRAARLRPPI